MTPEKIKHSRLVLQESQADFARRVGVSTTTISYWESGRSQPTQRYTKALDGIQELSLKASCQPQAPFRSIQYLGSKQRLAGSIAEVAGMVGSGERIGDLFAGTGVVSSVLAANRPVTAVDVQQYSSLLTRALLTSRIEDFEPAFTDAFWADVHDVEARLSAIASPLLQFEQDALKAAEAGRPSELVNVIEFGSLAVHRQRPNEGCPRHLSQLLSSTLRALEASRWDIRDISAFHYFGGPYFSYGQAIELDSLGVVARRLPPRQALALQGALLSTASEIVNTVGKQFAQPIKLRKAAGDVQPLLLDRTLKDRARDVTTTFLDWLSKWATALPSAQHQHRVVCGDVIEFLEHDRSCAAFYADPPYTIDHYSRFYHVLETLVRRDAPELAEMNKDGCPTVMRGVYRSERFQSPFCIPSKARAAFESLFQLASSRRVPLLLSYSPFEEGSAARPRLLALDDLLALGRASYRSVELIEIDDHSHRKLNAKAKNVMVRRDAERLLLCKP